MAEVDVDLGIGRPQENARDRRLRAIDEGRDPDPSPQHPLVELSRHLPEIVSAGLAPTPPPSPSRGAITRPPPAPDPGFAMPDVGGALLELSGIGPTLERIRRGDRPLTPEEELRERDIPFLPKLVSGILELTPLAGAIRRNTGAYADLSPELAAEQERRDLEAAMPGVALVGGVVAKAKVAQKAVTGTIESVATAQADAALRIERNTISIRPGFLQTAEQRIGSGVASTVAATPPKADEVFREIGANLDLMGIPQEAKELIIRNAARNVDPATGLAFSNQRRGVQSVGEMLAEAQRLAPGLDIEKLAEATPGTAFKAETLRSMVEALQSKSVEVLDLQAQLAKSGDYETKFRLLVSSVEMQTLQRTFAGARAEAGRSLRILRELTEAQRAASPKAIYERAAQVIGGRKNAEEYFDRLDNLWADDGVRTAGQRERDVYRFISGLDEASAFAKTREFWRNSILSLPITHEINMIGNALLLTAERTATRTAAATWEELVTVHGLRRQKDVTFSEILPGAIGTFTGIRRGLQKGLHVLTTGVDPEDVSKFRETGRLGRSQALEGKPGAILNLPTRLLGAEDKLFYEMAFSGEIAAQAARAATREGLHPLSRAFVRRVAELSQKPTAGILEAAEKHAKLVTLKSDPDAATQLLLQARRKVPALEFVAPFIQTPVNLIKLGVAYSPLGFARAVPLSGEARALMIGRATVGSGILAYFATKMLEGEVTAGAPEEAKERQAFFDSGKRPYAVKVGDSWVEFRRFEPFGTPLAWVASMHDVWKRTGKVDDKLVEKMASVMGRAVLDTTYLSGMSQFINALEDPYDAGARFFSRVATGFVPFSGFLRGLAGVEDPYVRDPEGLVEQINASLPSGEIAGVQFGSRTVKAKQTAFGEDALRPPSRQGLGALLNPLVISPEVEDRVLMELEALTVPGELLPDGTKTPDRPLLIGFPADEIRGMKLTTAEAFRLNQIAGRLAKGQLDELFQGEEYQGSTPQRRRQLAERLIDQTRREARGLVADEIVESATDDTQLARGALMRISTIGPLRSRADYIWSLGLQDKLPAAVREELDANRRQPLDGSPEPTVAEYLRYAPLIREYLSQPPFRIGNPEEWARVDALRKTADEYARSRPRPSGVTITDWYSQVDRDGAVLLRKYAPDWVVNPKRRELRQKHPQLERFLSDTAYVQVP